MNYLRLLPFLLVGQFSFAQRPITVYRDAHDSSRNFYTVRLPKSPVKGLLVLNARSLPDSSNVIASKLGIAILSVVPVANNLDNFTSTSLLDTMDAMIGEVLSKYRIPNNKVIIGGMSVAGTGSIRYAQYCAAKHSKNNIVPCGVFGVDPPLDYVRLYNEADKSVRRNFNEDAVAEGKLLVKLLTDELKGTPATNLKTYIDKSPYCYLAPDGGNAHWLNNLAVRLYTEPDIEWWIKNRWCDKLFE